MRCAVTQAAGRSQSFIKIYTLKCFIRYLIFCFELQSYPELRCECSDAGSHVSECSRGTGSEATGVSGEWKKKKKSTWKSIKDALGFRNKKSGGERESSDGNVSDSSLSSWGSLVGLGKKRHTEPSLSSSKDWARLGLVKSEKKKGAVDGAKTSGGIASLVVWDREKKVDNDYSSDVQSERSSVSGSSQPSHYSKCAMPRLVGSDR